MKYQYVILSKTHRYEARIAERSINLEGLKAGDKMDVQVRFLLPGLLAICAIWLAICAAYR